LADYGREQTERNKKRREINNMTKTLEITGSQARVIKDGLLAMSYSYQETIDNYNMKITEARLRGKDTELLETWRNQAREKMEIADRTYNQIKELGLVW
jgi:hypothetical protein